MFMKDDKKKQGLSMLIVSKYRANKNGEKKEEIKEAPKNENGDQVDNSMPLKTAAEELIQALNSKDASLVVDALNSYIDIKMSESEDKEDSNEQEEIKA